MHVISYIFQLDRITKNNKWIDDGYGSIIMHKRRRGGIIETNVVSNVTNQMAAMTKLLKTMSLNNSMQT